MSYYQFEVSASNWVRTSDVLTKTDYESVAFDHSATDARMVEVVGFEPTSNLNFYIILSQIYLKMIFQDV